ncbi:hyoscyamine 6-dioxygenase-like [Cynara cardunculus var. scolymus]|uniref:hyoscyamine 6-dioxygenase-like n=1 Tax=Cynara cardunculus var. scolymus TaxID=59895 RepID=UPI000D625221|nr:hyoscyamine 6-dioxygenase-like [Cynara cardunculus var. scolymus]
MENLISSWCTTVKSLPLQYVFPEDKRPGDQIVPNFDNCPVIDLEKAVSGDRNAVIQQVLQASQDCGLFQVINHGISEDLIKDAMEIVKEFFNMPNEDKASLYSLDPQKSCRLYTSSFDYVGETVHRWRDVLKHICDPVEGWVDSWPQKPSKYREVVGKYSIEVRNLSFRILEMIHEGLELGPGYFGDDLTGAQNLLLNHYPPCPEPSLALGISKHSDPNVITILYQENIGGLQVMKDGQWVGIEPIPNALVVMIGHLLKVVSNGKLESAEHRAVTNAKESRYTIGSSINPRSKDVIVEPVKALLEKDGCHPLYRAFSYKDYHQVYKENRGEGEPTLEVFKIKG